MSSPCAICRGRTASLGEKRGFTLSRCTACGFAFCDPMPSHGQLAALYREESDIAVDSYPKSPSRFRRAFIKAIKFGRFIRGHDLIDVGCGGGFVAEAMRRVGGRATGIDVSENSIAYANRRFPNCEFAAETLEEFAKQDRKFDFIYCSEVIEHVPDLDSFVTALAQICRLDGKLFVITPDIGHWRVPKDIVSWNVVDPPRHVRYFTDPSLRMLLERHGFVIRRKIFKVKPGLQVLAERV